MTMNSSGAILDCGGKRSATPLSDRTNSGVALHLPPQSKSVHWQAQINGPPTASESSARPAPADSVLAPNQPLFTPFSSVNIQPGEAWICNHSAMAGFAVHVPFLN